MHGTRRCVIYTVKLVVFNFELYLFLTVSVRGEGFFGYFAGVLCRQAVINVIIIFFRRADGKGNVRQDLVRAEQLLCRYAEIIVRKIILVPVLADRVPPGRIYVILSVVKQDEIVIMVSSLALAFDGEGAYA